MKSIIRNVVVAFFVCGGVLSVSAQTQEQIDYMRRNSDLDAARELQARLDNDFQENHQRALDLAKQNGWPLTVNNPDGSYSELKGVTTNGDPMYYITSNHGSAITSRVNKIQPGGGDGLNLDGKGMLAGVWDGDKPLTTHVDLLDSAGANRLTSVNDGTTFPSVALHATHVMGTILSSGVNDAQARGMAYNAKGIYADWTNDLAEMQTAVTKKGLLLSNHSYNLVAGNEKQNMFGAYITDSKNVDDLLFANPFYQPCWSAGNDRDSYSKYNPTKGGHDLLTGFAVAKNVITVAAVLQVDSYVDANSVVMSDFSNWGPTDDNRIKPDISDKGYAVYSTEPDTPLPVAPAVDSNKSYGYLQGTSMATPGVTGALLLIQQYYAQLNSPAFMRSATLRGLLAHSADEAGTSPGPDSKFGWGLINAERMAKTITDSKTQNSIINELTLGQVGAYTTTVFATGVEPLVATIAWTDKSGTINETVADQTNPVLVNDLDIRITKDGVTSLPWKLAGTIVNNNLPAVKQDNKVDNIEKIEVDNTVRGTYTITITHKGTLVGKDSLHMGANATQDYSLIVTGIEQNLAVEQNDFKEFNVWPNPANDLLNVSIQSDLSSEAFLTLYDIQGRRVVSQKLDESDTVFGGVVNIDSLNPGIYLVKVTQGNKQSIRKVVKE